MLDNFIRHIQEKNLLDPDAHYLLAASGGLDSTVLANLLKLSGFTFSMAHCNFELRGKESEEDETFVRKLAADLEVKIYVKKFETKVYAGDHGISIQMAARELRYQWFDELLNAEGFAGLIVAHHADDQVETIFLNLLRGTGIEGVYGMAERKGKIIRPLLAFRRKELENFAAEKGYVWKEDSSNSKIDYKRNFLRHRVLPQFAEFDSSAHSLLQFSFERVKETGKAFFHLFEEWLARNLLREGDFHYLKTATLANAPGRKALLFYWLKPSGFTYFQMDHILRSIEKNEPGKTFHSEEYSLNLDREYLILGRKKTESEEWWIGESAIEMETNEGLYDVLTLRQNFRPDPSSANAMLDKDSLRFPLKLRKWQLGDKFRPLGMKSFKKISDFLIDLKIPLILKNQIQVLCSENEIVWVVGYRIDDRFKLTSLTKTALYLKKSTRR